MAPIDILLIVIDVFKRFGIRYFIVGSFASSRYGMPRTTLDADVIADLTEEQAVKLCDALKNDFYADDDSAREAVRNCSSFNVIHQETAFKVDVFVLKKNDAYAMEEFNRRREEVPNSETNTKVFFATAEDSILSKLHWYKSGGETSHKQWDDIIGILQAQKDKLNADYLKKWSCRLGVDDLLEKAFAESDRK